MNILHSPKQQRGAALIIAMVILLVMSLIGLSSVVSSTLQERMASNVQQRTLARYAAETAIRAAEVYIAENFKSRSKLSLFNGSNAGLYADIAATPILLFGDLVRQASAFTDGDLSKPTHWTAANSVEVLDLSDKVTAQNPRYSIEYVGQRREGPISFFSTSGNIGNSSPYMFKITAIGWARDSAVYSILQTHFTTGSGDFDYED